MRKIISIVLVMVLLASAVPLAITPAAAYEKKIPGDADGNNELTKEELVNAILPYMLDEGDLKLDDVGDAAYVYAYWDGEPRTIIDQAKMGREVTFYRSAERMVIASADSIPALIELGVTDRIVGIGWYAVNYMLNPSRWCPVYYAAPELKELPTVGKGTTVSDELVVSLRPDVVFTHSIYVAFMNSFHEKTNIPVVGTRDLSGNRLDCKKHRLIGKIVGREEEAEELISYVNEQIAKVTEVTSQINDSEKPRVYFATGRITKTISDYDAIELAGGVNVASELSGTFPSYIGDVSKEQVIKWNPDIILIHGVRPPHSFSMEDILSDPDLQSINAVKNHNINYTIGQWLGWDVGTGLTEVFYMAKLFHPDEFEDLDEEEEGNGILERFYGVDGIYTKMFGMSDRYRWE